MSSWQTGQTNAEEYSQYNAEPDMNDGSQDLFSPFSAAQMGQIDMSQEQREYYGQNPNQEPVPHLTSSSFSATHQVSYSQHRGSRKDREARPLAPEYVMPSHTFYDHDRDVRNLLADYESPARGLPLQPPYSGIRGVPIHRDQPNLDDSNLMLHSNAALLRSGPSAPSDMTNYLPSSHSELERRTTSDSFASSLSMPNRGTAPSMDAPGSQEGLYVRMGGLVPQDQRLCTGCSQPFAAAAHPQMGALAALTAMYSACTSGTGQGWTSLSNQTSPAEHFYPPAGVAQTSPEVTSAGSPASAMSDLPLSENDPADIHRAQYSQDAKTASSSRNDETESFHLGPPFFARSKTHPDEVEMYCCEKHGKEKEGSGPLWSTDDERQPLLSDKDRKAVLGAMRNAAMVDPR